MVVNVGDLLHGRSIPVQFPFKAYGELLVRGKSRSSSVYNKQHSCLLLSRTSSFLVQSEHEMFSSFSHSNISFSQLSALLLEPDNFVRPWKNHVLLFGIVRHILISIVNPQQYFASQCKSYMYM